MWLCHRLLRAPSPRLAVRWVPQEGPRCRFCELHGDEHATFASRFGCALRATFVDCVATHLTRARRDVVLRGHGRVSVSCPIGVERAAAALRWLTVAILPSGAVGRVARTRTTRWRFRTPVKISTAMARREHDSHNFGFVARLAHDLSVRDWRLGHSGSRPG